MVPTYTLNTEGETGAALASGKIGLGRSTASDAAVGASSRVKSALKKLGLVATTGATDLISEQNGARTNWWWSVVAECLAWIAYQWRRGQAAAHRDSLFEERLAERTRIAQDLHDTLLQGFLSASMQLHVANDHLPSDSPAKPLVGRVLDLLNRAAEDGRKAVRGLRSSWDSEDLETAFSRVPQELGVPQTVDFRVAVEGRGRPLHPLICDEIYRIGREALANAFRHAQANNIELELEYANKQLRLSVRDDGRGIDPQVLRSGRDGHWGLSGMRERAERIGARLKVWSRKGGGTEVELSVPGQVAFRSDPSARRLQWFSAWPRRQAEHEIYAVRH